MSSVVKPTIVEYYSKLIPDKSVFDNIEYRLNVGLGISFDYYLYDGVYGNKNIEKNTNLYRGFYKMIFKGDEPGLFSIFGQNSISKIIHSEKHHMSDHLVYYIMVTNFDHVGINLNENIKYLLGVPL